MKSPLHVGRSLLRTIGVLGVVGAILGTALTAGAPHPGHVWALQAPEPMSSPIDQPNDPPVIGQLDGDTVTYQAGDVPTLLDQTPGAIVTDPDSPRFDAGRLSVSITAGGVASEDVLSLTPGADVALSNGTNIGSIVSVLGVAIGTVSGDGRDGGDLVIDLGIFANPTAASLLVQAVSYRNLDALTPTAGARTVRFTVDDGAGGISSPVYVTANVVSNVDAEFIHLPLVIGGQTTN